MEGKTGTETRRSSASDEHSQKGSLRQGERETSFCCPPRALGTSKVKADEQGGGRLSKACLPESQWRESWGYAPVREQQRVSAEGVERSMGALTFWQDVLPCPETSTMGLLVQAQRPRVHPREGSISISLFQPGKSTRKCQHMALPAP